VQVAAWKVAPFVAVVYSEEVAGALPEAVVRGAANWPQYWKDLV
jgi:hypothetical protein